MSCLYILDINPLSLPWLANIFCCSSDYLLILFMVSFAVQKHLSLIRCHLFIFVVVLLFSCSALSDSLQPHGLQHTRLPCPSLSPRVSPSSCPLSRWCCPTTSSSTTPLSFCLQSSQHQGFFSNELAVHIRWPKYWNFSFSISPSNKYSGLISFRIDWFDLLDVQGTLKSFLQHHNSKASILWYPSLWSNSHIHHDYWKDHRFD